MEELQPPIYISGLRIGEPMTALTDFLVSAVCLYAFVVLRREKEIPAKRYFRYYFLLLSIATFWGGLVTHAFVYALSQLWKVPGWITSTWAVSILSFAMVRYHHTLVGKYSLLLVTLIVIELLLAMSVIIYKVQFTFAGVHSAFGLFLIVGGLSAISFFKYKDKGSSMMLIGIGIFLVSGIVFSAVLSPGTWFNHVDLTHILLAVAAWQIYKSVVVMINQQSAN